MEKKYTLPIEFGEKWIAALRSGEYEQGKDRLKKGNRFCCLGVACSIAGATEKQISNYAYIPKKSKINVPHQIKGESVNQSSLAHILTVKNDAGSTFPEIADWIEQNVNLI